MCASVVTKRCSKCKFVKPSSDFSSNRRQGDGLDSHCRVCIRERMRQKRARHRAAGECSDCGAPLEDSPSQWYCRRCSTRYQTRGTAGSRNLRTQVLQGYGGAKPHCICCGEAEVRFLTIDHQKNGGRAHRHEKGNQGVYYELRRNGFPPGFRVLCFNCNLAPNVYARGIN